MLDFCEEDGKGVANWALAPICRCLYIWPQALQRGDLMRDQPMLTQ